MTSSDQIEATSSGRAVRTNVSFRMSSAPLAFWSRYIHRWSSGSLSWWIVQIYLIGYTPLMLKVFLVNYWYICIENILRESIKVFLRRPPRVRNDLDEALLSSKKVINNENDGMVIGDWRWFEDLVVGYLQNEYIQEINFSSLHCIDRFFASSAHFTLHSISILICPRSWTSAFTFRLAKAQFMQLDVWTLGTQLAELHLLPKWKWS